MLTCIKPVKDVVEQNADLSKRANLDEVLACALDKTNLEENMVFMQVILSNFGYTLKLSQTGSFLVPMHHFVPGEFSSVVEK